MKRTILILSTLIFSISFASAQKVGFFESQKVLDKMPVFKTVNDEIDAQADEWKKQVDAKFDEVDTKYNYYVANESMLSESDRQNKQQEIIDLEKEANDLKKEFFGYDGKLQQLRSEKIDPLMDQLNEAVKKVASDQSFDFIFEKSDESVWVVTNEKYNITDLIIAELGL